MNQYISQEDTRRIIINDMVKKRNSIVPIIGDTVVVYKGKDFSEEIPFQEFILREFQKKYPHVEVPGAVHNPLQTHSVSGGSTEG